MAHLPQGSRWRRLALAALLLAAAGGLAAQQRTPANVLSPGEPFPPLILKDLAAPPGSPANVELGQVLGRKPVLLCYWIPGLARSEDLLRDMQALVAELGPDRIALYSLVKLQPGREADVVVKRARELGVEVPVLDDDSFKLGKLLRVERVPHVTLIDREGRLRLAAASSLKQTLEYKMDLRAAIRRAAETGKVGTYGYLPLYHPVQELVGQPCPDFSARMLEGESEKRWSGLLDPRRVNVLIFWTVDCPHCRRVLPEISTWVKDHTQDVNVFSAAMVDTPAARAKTREFCQTNGFNFPTLVDQDHKVAEQFFVTSTPTILIIRPDGVVDSVLLSDVTDFGRTLEQKKRELLPAAGS